MLSSLFSPLLSVSPEKKPTTHLPHESGYLEGKRNDRQLKKLFIVEQILLFSAIGNEGKTVWRICILIIKCN